MKVAAGTGVVLVGTIVGMVLAFISRVIIVRYVTMAEYGVFSLGVVLLNIFVVISCLGLQQGAVRNIAFFRGKDDLRKTHGVVISSIQIVIIASILCTVFLYFSADIIAEKLFHSRELLTVLKIFSLGIPFFAMIMILTSIFRGFDKVDAKVYFQDVLRNVLFPIFLIFVIFFNFSFFGVLCVYLASIIITCVAFVVYTIKKLPIFVSVKSKVNSISATRKNLLFFSLPLLGTTILSFIMSWTDTLMLGYFKTPEVVGLYNAALPIAQLIPIFLVSMVFIYTPIATQLYSKNLLEEMKRNYAILTKWIFSATLPFVLVIFLFPTTVLDFLFGYKYIGASIVLQILVIGFFIHTFLGPNGSTLLVMGETKVLMRYALISPLVNIILNIALIPTIGVIGAAIASAISLIIANGLISTHLYKSTRIHPFTKNYLKPIGVSFLIVISIYLITRNIFVIIPFWSLPVLFALFLLVYGISLLLTKSFDKEDIIMLLLIEKRLGVNLTRFKNFLRRFI